MYDNISVERESKGIKITITGNLFKSTSAEIDSSYYPVIYQIGQLISESDLINIHKNDKHKEFLKIIDNHGANLILKSDVRDILMMLSFLQVLIIQVTGNFLQPDH